MKFIKYKFYNRLIRREEKIRFRNLNNIQKRDKIISNIISSFIVLIYVFSIFLLGYLGVLLLSKITITIWKIMLIILLTLVIIVIPFLIMCGLFMLFNKFIPPYTRGKLCFEDIAEMTKPLKDYYKVSTPCVITKCYRSTNKYFNNKDVVIYLYKDKIRLTLDYTRTYVNLGCYEFDFKKIEYYNIKEDNLLKTVLKCEDVEFVLGYRARTFINNYCTNK